MEPQEEKATRHSTHDNIQFLHDLRYGPHVSTSHKCLVLGAATIMKACNQIVTTREARMGARLTPARISVASATQCCKNFPIPDGGSGTRGGGRQEIITVIAADELE